LVRQSVVNVESLTMRSISGRMRPVAKQTASGIAINGAGHVMTNCHAVDGASLIRVTAPDGTQYAAHIVGADADRDLALLMAPGLRVPAAAIGDSDAIQVGQSVIAVGNPFGIGITVTLGIVSATDRRNLPLEQGRRLPRVIQTDAAMNHGSSGGALATMDGKIIGLCTAILADGPEGGPLGVGFAIPMNDLAGLASEWIRHPPKVRAPEEAPPFLGFSYSPVPPAVAAQLGAPPGRCLIVLRVWPMTPADTAKMHRGDIIVGAEGKPVLSAEHLRRAIASKEAGETLALTLMRGGGGEETVRVRMPGP
jgi:S1-C subfamily serine protease